MYRRWLIPFATMLMLWWLVAELNHSLGSHGVHLYVGGLLVTYAALRLSLRHGLAATLLLGLAIDAMEPMPVIDGHPFYGLHLMLLASALVVIYQLRGRFPREETMFRILTAAAANLVLYLCISFAFLRGQPSFGVTFERLLVDFLWSELFVVVVAPWFFAFQERALVVARVDMADERRRSF